MCVRVCECAQACVRISTIRDHTQFSTIRCSFDRNAEKKSGRYFPTNQKTNQL